MIVMLSDSDSDGEYDPALPVQLLSVRSLSAYLRSEGFSKADVQELASESLHAKNFDPNFGRIRGLRWEVIRFCEFCFILCFVLVFVLFLFFFTEIK